MICMAMFYKYEALNYEFDIINPSITYCLLIGSKEDVGAFYSV